MSMGREHEIATALYDAAAHMRARPLTGFGLGEAEGATAHVA